MVTFRLPAGKIAVSVEGGIPAIQGGEDVKWLLEKTIKHPQNDIKLRNALNSLNIDFIEVDKKPFVPLDITEIQKKILILYMLPQTLLKI